MLNCLGDPLETTRPTSFQMDRGRPTRSRGRGRGRAILTRYTESNQCHGFSAEVGNTVTSATWFSSESSFSSTQSQSRGRGGRSQRRGRGRMKPSVAHAKYDLSGELCIWPHNVFDNHHYDN